MLEISNICKDYILKDQKVEALKSVSVCFRRSEFVSILGPSGCGKTTLLNIIGGLDRYTSGDLIIDGISTKKFKDADWDNYRNHRVGFVFQSYNLIPHQTVLENVELALTLSGVKKKERRERAIEVLTKVGLGDKLKSKPNQLSGGQMQRVAIARALVNDPEIILADEPTGALDSKTSVQIMELLKEVSKDRLVVMVTHNPELAQKYSSRIIRLFDGELTNDSQPYSVEEATKEIEKHKKLELKKEKSSTFTKTEKKKHMSLGTALSLSLKNLLTKKGRTIMVSFAGSIGIIGIALILAVSTGLTNYINNMQSESLSSYPISVSAVSMDLTNVSAYNNKGEAEDDEEVVYDMLEMLKSYGQFNYLSKDFVNYITEYYDQSSKQDLYNELKVLYASDMHLITQVGADSTSYMYPINNTVTCSASTGGISSTFFEGLENTDYVKTMYDVHGKYPTEANEIALVLQSSSISNMDLTSYGIELPSKKEDGKYNNLKFEDIIDKKTYKLVFNDAYYQTDSYDPYYDFSKFSITDLLSMKPEALAAQGTLNTLYNLEENVKTLTVTAVLTKKEDASGSVYNNGFMYTKALADEYRANCIDSNIVNLVKQTYLAKNAQDEIINNGDARFSTPFTLKIQELSMLGSMISTEIDSSAYTYYTPNAIIQALKDMFDMDLSYENTVDLYLQMYGASNIPTGIYVYVDSFEAKDDFADMLKEWNNKEGVYKIYYTDTSSVLTNALGSIVDIISYVLIAFAGISLVVSSIMIAIITYTSVIERTKEIGVLRSVGASKRDVSRVFNAETIIIGLLAGTIGIGVSFLITLPLELILRNLTGVAGLATMELGSSLILIAISVFLTFVAGLIPAKIASKKDPVLALRSE